MSDGKRSTPPGAALAWSDDADPELIVAAEATATGYQGHGLVVHDAGGAIVAASDGACGLLGLTRAELFDRTSHDSPWSAVSAQGLPVAGQDHPAMRVLAAGEAVLDSMLGVAVQTGPTSHVNRWLAVSALPILADPGSTLDADGGSGDVRLLGVLAAFTDVSDSDRGRAATALLLGNYRLLAENATDIVYRLDSDNVLLWVSPSVEAVLGWRPEQLLGTQSFALAHPDDQAKLFQWRAELIGGGVPRPVELRGRTVDGSYRWMSVQSRLAEGPDGIKGAVVGVRDINDEVLVRQALAESEKRYRLLAENSTDVVVLVNSDWTLTWVSSATRQVLGFEPKDLVGTQSADLIHPEDLPILLAARAAIDPDGKGVSYEVRVRTAYGTYLWMSGLSRTVVDSDGVEVGRISTLRDVHERVVALTALAQSESRYRMVAENATDVVWQLAADLTLQWATPSIESVLGWSQEQVLGTPIVELVHPEDRQTILAWGTDVVAGKNMAPFEVRVATDDGHYRWMSVNTRPTTGSDGVLTGVIIGLRDADDEVHARAQLARSEQMFRLAMDGAPQGMAVIGLHLAFLQVNAALCQMLGRDEEWMLSHTIRDVTHPADLEEDLSDRDELLRGSAASKVRECRWVRADGTSVWVVHSTGLLRDEAHMPLFYVSHVQDNTVTHEVRAELVYRAGHDSLTGLMNRDQMQDRISAVLDHQPRRGGSPVLLYCDLDRFKGINDTYGHAAGDFVLKMTAERITACLRSDDWVARLGGDEFVVVLPEIHDLPSASGVAQKIRKSVAQPLQLGQTDMSITISIGIALAPVNIEAHRLLRNADAALYVAKHAGRDQISVYEDDEFGD